MPDNKQPQFDKVNLDEASEQLRHVMGEIAKFNTIWDTLSQQERAALGGIVFHLVSIWGDFHLMGSIVERPYGVFMINNLTSFFNNPPVQGKILISGIESFTKGGGDGTKVN